MTRKLARECGCEMRCFRGVGRGFNHQILRGSITRNKYRCGFSLLRRSESCHRDSISPVLFSNDAARHLKDGAEDET